MILKMSFLFSRVSTSKICLSTTFWQCLDKIARHMLSTLFALLIIIVFSSPLPIPGSTELLFAIIINTVFFWSLWCPSSMPVLSVFLIGIFMDLTGSSPLGISTLTLLLVYGITDYYRLCLTRLHFFVVWCVFSLIGSCIAILQWLLVCLFDFHILNPIPAFFEAFLCIGIYPLFSMICYQVLYFLSKKHDNT